MYKMRAGRFTCLSVSLIPFKWVILGQIKWQHEADKCQNEYLNDKHQLEDKLHQKKVRNHFSFCRNAEGQVDTKSTHLNREETIIRK